MVQNFSSLEELKKYCSLVPSFQEGEIAKAGDKTYAYINGEWIEQTAEVSISLIDVNKQLLANAPAYDLAQAAKALRDLNSYHMSNEYGYYMLYGKELGYFTLFESDLEADSGSLGEEVIECVHNIGDILSMEEHDNDDAIEFWVRTHEGDVVTYLCLFPYDDAIVRFRG